MTDVVVSGDDDASVDLQAQSAHDAAVAQGAAAVHEQQAGQAAVEAAAAAEAAIQAAQANLSATDEAVAAGETAQMAAMDASASRDAILEAIGAQTGAINTLVEELRSARASAEPPAPKKTSSDRQPARKRKGSFYWGG